MNTDFNLYLVEFGEPDTGGGWSISIGGENQKPLFVVALDYNEAAVKAMKYAEAKAKQQPVLDSEGFLRTQYTQTEQKPLTIKAVKLAAKEIIW